MNVNTPKQNKNLNAVKHQFVGHIETEHYKDAVNKIQTVRNYGTKTQFLQQINCKGGKRGGGRNLHKNLSNII